MRTVYLIRHAKSSWADMSLKDFDRSLNKRGKRDALVMAEWLKEHISQLDAIISSPAERAKLTAIEFSKAFDVSIQYQESMYHAGEDEILSAIYGVDDSLMHIALFGHNPGFTYFANEFIKTDFIDNVPTCGIVGISSTANKWSDFSNTNSKFKFFMYPKKLIST